MQQAALVNITAVTISLSSNNGLLSFLNNNKISNLHWLLNAERALRKKAYSQTIIKTDPAFFDDSDMQKHYFLVLVYDTISHTPLLSARYYYDKKVIMNYLKGDSGIMPTLVFNNKPFHINNYADNELLLADRLSGNIPHELYRKNRLSILSCFYNEISQLNKNNTIILMVRETKQMQKYISLGFQLMGSVIHKSIIHYVVISTI